MRLHAYGSTMLAMKPMPGLVRWLVLALVVALALGVSPLAWADSGDDNITRGRFALLLAQQMGIVEEGMSDPAAAADLLVARGIMQGYPGGDLGLDQPISRVEAAALIARSFGLRDDLAPPPWAPIRVPANLSANHWGYNLYAWLVQHGAMAAGQAPEQFLSDEEAQAILAVAFAGDDEARALNEQTRERSAAQLQDMGFETAGTMHMQMYMNPEAVADAPFDHLDMAMDFTQRVVVPTGLYQRSTMRMNVPGTPAEEITTELYWVDGTMVQQVPHPETGEPFWFRMPDEAVIDFGAVMEASVRQTSLPPELQEYFVYKLLGTQRLDDEEVYAIAFYGRVDDFAQFMDAVFGALGDVPLPASTQVADMIRSVSYWGIQYIGVEDLLDRAMEYSTIVLYADQFQGEPSPVTMVRTDMRIDEIRYGRDLPIELPEEALTAPVLGMDQDEDPSDEELSGEDQSDEDPLE